MNAPLADPAADRQACDDEAVEVLARTLYGEARGETLRGQEAVAAAILNRVKRARARGGYWWGDTVIEVCRRPHQFSCWNEDDPNRAKLEAVRPGNKIFDACLRIARRAVAGTLDDPTLGSTHYHTAEVRPAWARRRAPAVVIGHHLFYNDVE